ncbi:hypothetical protein L1049_007367 [Liquidambar formosana]|uniref:ZNF598/HEL2 PAH domain-containing protein n=1 Tax=Liquidambar formosana TaxID=63359 RepID=A0AAP0R351_LIQFO
MPHTLSLSPSHNQIPTSFRYRRSSEQDNRRGRGRTFHRDSSDNQLSMAIQASFETANADDTFHEPSSSSSSAQVVSDRGETNDIDPIVQPFESLATSDSEPSSRYLQALSHSRNVPLEESSFPPLPNAPGSSQQKSQQASEGLPKNTMAAYLRRQNKRNVIVLNSGQALPASIRGPVLPPSTVNSAQHRPSISSAPVLSMSSSQVRPVIVNGPSPSSYASSAQARPTTVQEIVSASTLRSKNLDSAGRISHSASAPNLVESRSFDPSISDFPPVSATQRHKFPAGSQPMSNVEDAHTANKLLVEKIRAALEFDEDKYTAFKDISGEYRQGLIDTGIYLAYVQQFGLSHLVLELARLCPDAQKQKEIIETYNASLQSNVPRESGWGTNGPRESGWGNGSVHLKGSSSSRKGKGKRVDAEECKSKNSLADSVLSSVRELQLSYKPSVEEAEILSKDGYRAAEGKSKVMVNEGRAELSSGSQLLTKLSNPNDSLSASTGSSQNLGDGGGGSKQRKKTSKFHRIRLGDGSAAALVNLKKSDLEKYPDPMEETPNVNSSTEGLPVRGVWRSGGGQRLFAEAPRDLRK